MSSNIIAINEILSTDKAKEAKEIAQQACSLYYTDMDAFEKFKTGKESLQPDHVTEATKQNILKLVKKLTVSYERFKNEPIFTSIETYIKIEPITSDLIRNNYLRSLFELYYLLGNSEKALGFADEALMQSKHPSMLQNFGVLIKLYPIEGRFEVIHTYLFNVVYVILTSPLPELLRSMLEADFKYLNYNDDEKLVSKLSSSCLEEGVKGLLTVLEIYYFNHNNFEKLRLLVDLLISHAKKSYQEIGKLLLIDCINTYVDNNRLDEMDKIFALDSLQNKPPILMEYQFYTAKLLIDKVALGKESNAENLTLALKYIENPLKNGDLEASILMVRVSLFYARSILDDPTYTQKGLKIIEDLEKRMAKMKRGEENELRGYFYNIVGYLIEKNLLPDSPKYKNDNKKAMEYYSKSADFNYIPSFIAMTRMYKINTHTVQQYFEKTEKCLLKGVALKSIDCKILLADLKLSMMATCEDIEKRKKLLQDGLDLIVPLSNLESQLTKKQQGDIYYLHAVLLFALDTGINRHFNNQTNEIPFYFSRDVIAQYSGNKTVETVKLVKKKLGLAVDKGQIQARLLLGILGQYGTYLECDYAESEIHFLICYKKGVYSIEELVGSYLYMSARTTNADEKGQYLKKALTYHQMHLSQVTTVDEKTQLEDVFSKQVQVNFPAMGVSVMASTNRQIFFNAPQEGSIENRLMRAMKTLNDALSDNEINENALLQGLLGVNAILNKSQADVPLYSGQLPKLQNSLELLQNKFLNLSLVNRIKVLELCSQWPLVCEKLSPLYNMYLLTGPSMLKTLADKVSVLLSMCHLKNKEGMCNELLESHLGDLNSISDCTDMTTVARLLHIFAITHANTDNSLMHALIQAQLEKFAKVFQDNLHTYYNQSIFPDKKVRSMIYNGLVYLHFAYKGVFPDLLKINTNFISECEKALMTEDIVGSVSKSQQQLFNVLVQIDKNYQQELIAGYRRVDFYNANIRVVGFFHGPVHYLYNAHGEPLIVNPATTLCTRVLELQKFVVFQISYLQLNEALTRGARDKLVRSMLPPCATPKPVITNCSVANGASSAKFWKNLQKLCNNEQKNMATNSALTFE